MVKNNKEIINNNNKMINDYLNNNEVTVVPAPVQMKKKYTPTFSGGFITTAATPFNIYWSEMAKLRDIKAIKLYNKGKVSQVALISILSGDGITVPEDKEEEEIAAAEDSLYYEKLDTQLRKEIEDFKAVL